MSILTNTNTNTYTTDQLLSENQTYTTPQTNEDTTSVAAGNNAFKVILAAEILDIITAGITLIFFLR